VARVSEVNESLYRAFLQPWVRAMVGPQLADAAWEMHPLRLSYSLFSDKNPMMRGVAAWAEQARAERAAPSSANPFLAMQEQVSDSIIKALDVYRDVREQMAEQVFHAVYGSPVIQALYGTSANDGEPRPRPGRSPLDPAGARGGDRPPPVTPGRRRAARGRDAHDHLHQQGPASRRCALVRGSSSPACRDLTHSMRRALLESDDLQVTPLISPAPSGSPRHRSPERSPR
jgi:hypothetical protein